MISGLDIGTTGCKLTSFDESGSIIYNSYTEYDSKRENGVHEIDPDAIWSGVKHVISDTAKKLGKIDAIGVSSFGESFVMLDENDHVLSKSMLYTDPRGKAEREELESRLGKEKIIDISGNKPHEMFSLPKLMWVKSHEPELFKKVRKVLLFEDFVVYLLTGIAQIDVSLAARAMALDIRKKDWSDEIFEASGIDKALFSKCVPSGTVAGKIKSDIGRELGLSDTVIVSGGHDQVVSAIGAGIFDLGTAADGTGTVECITPVLGEIPTDYGFYEGGYSVVPYVFNNTYVCYAFSFTGGAVLKWFRDNLLQSDISYKELDSSIPDEPTGILVLPHFAGAATPYMDTGSKAAVVGLTLGTKKQDFYKALMEGVTYEIRLNAEKLHCSNIEKYYATGGGASSRAWLQIKADILGKPITALDIAEVGAAGTAMLTGVATGVFASLHDSKKVFLRELETYYPDPRKAEIYQSHFNRYLKIYDAVRPLSED